MNVTSVASHKFLSSNNMNEVLPAILVASQDEFEARIRAIESHSAMAHIDILDGTWRPEKTWADPRAITNILSPLHYELHLMVANPIEHLDAWTEIPAIKRVIFHYETVTQPTQIIEAIRFHGWDVVMAINPETPESVVHEYIHYVDEIMCMTVAPGAAGRPFEPSVLEKISAIAGHHPDAIIGVDGAISAETLLQCRAAGAKRFRANSSVFATEADPIAALTALEQTA